MRLAAHPPCFMPSILFFYKMCRADLFVLMDDLQFTTHNFINRTKIKIAAGVDWLTIPVRTKGKGKQLINQVLIENTQNWRKKHLKTLLVNYRYAAYFEQYFEYFEQIYVKEWTNLIDLNLGMIEFLKKTLNITTKCVLSSDLNLKGQADIRLIDMMLKLDCSNFYVEETYRKILNEDAFYELNLTLEYLSFEDSVYHQLFGCFVSGLSTIDLLFNEGDESRKIIVMCDS